MQIGMTSTSGCKRSLSLRRPPLWGLMKIYIYCWHHFVSVFLGRLFGLESIGIHKHNPHPLSEGVNVWQVSHWVSRSTGYRWSAVLKLRRHPVRHVCTARWYCFHKVIIRVIFFVPRHSWFYISKCPSKRFYSNMVQNVALDVMICVWFYACSAGGRLRDVDATLAPAVARVHGNLCRSHMKRTLDNNLKWRKTKYLRSQWLMGICSFLVELAEWGEIGVTVQLQEFI